MANLCKASQRSEIVMGGRGMLLVSARRMEGVRSMATAVAMLTLFSCAAAEEEALDFNDDSPADAAVGSACRGISPRAISEQARAFMLEQQMIDPNDEISFEGFSSRWRARRAVASDCLLYTSDAADE